MSEAVKSMLQWYKHTQVCYAHSADVTESGNLEQPADGSRGWNLQELIAPAKDIFCAGSNWVQIGTKATLLKAISTFTGIQAPILENVAEMSKASTAQKMSWASKTQTIKGSKTLRIVS